MTARSRSAARSALGGDLHLADTRGGAWPRSRLALAVHWRLARL